NQRKPKYMELYSSSPPPIAPRRFMAKIPDTCPLPDNNVENTIPENRSGQVSTTAVSSRPVEGEANPPARETYHPIARPAPKNTNGASERLMRNRETAQLPRNAMIRMPAITIPITCQVLPNVRPISVMPLVSISMNPTPRKKNGVWLSWTLS